MAQWKHEFSEPPIDLPTILRGSRPAEPDQSDWRVSLDQSIRAFAQSVDDLAEALDEGGDRAAYVRANAKVFKASDLTKIQLVCSIITVMAENRGRLEAAE